MARVTTRPKASAKPPRRPRTTRGVDRSYERSYAALRRAFPFLTAERTLRGGEWLHGLTLRLTTRCNQRCPFCQAADPRSEADPSSRDLLRAADRIAELLPGASVILTGGEPCLRPDLPELLTRLLERPGIRLVELQTNAVPLGSRTAALRLPVSDRLRVLVGLHALDPGIYDACTATRGQLPAALLGIRRLLDAGATVELNCVVSRLNLAHVPRLPELLARALGPRPPPLHFSVLGIPEQREVGHLLVRFGELLDAVAEAHRRAEPLGAVVRLAPSASHAVVPVCLLARRPDLPVGGEVGYAHEGPDADRDRWWVQGNACRACVHRTRCRGVPRSYAERFGFGELEPVRPAEAGPDAARRAASGVASRRRVELGPAGRRLLDRWLAFDGDDRFAVTRARWLIDRLELALRAPGDATVELVLEASAGAGERRPFLSNGRVDLWYRGSLPEGLEPPLRAAFARLGAAPLERLLEPLLSAPDVVELPEAAETAATGAPDGGARGDATQGGGEKVLLGTWDPETTFADFLGRDTMDLMPYEAIEASNPLVRISHSDLECLSFMPRECAANLNLVDFPWIAQRERSGTAVKQQETILCTDLDERSVILGCGDRIRRVLDAVLEVDAGKPIVFSNTCLPATTGEDAISVLRLYRRRAAVSVVSHNRAAPDRDDDMPSALVSERRPAARVRRRPDLVNLIGFPHDRTLDELTRLLEDVGLRVNAVLLPVVRPEDVERFPRASLNVFHRTNRFWEDSYRRLAAEHPIPSLDAPSPYGIAGTRRWLAAVADAAGRRSRAREAWARRFAPLRGEWRRLTAQARELAVGLVVRPRDVECLEDPGLTNGVPLLAVLADLGFGLEVWIHARNEALDALHARIEAQVPPACRARCRIAGFDDLDGLRRALRDSPAAAVVGNHTFDWRLTEAGKNRISLRQFEKGPEGALRTARRLLDACRVPFARRYARFLARDDLGRRRMPPAED
ncbi:MAG: radical SAM protein [Deltaproteobacteria bacterium]|nr:radical SAM protein [Deltaproteobacteria bacterium]